ncbi:hypothetical protein GCM10028807_62250 [Spirosoma daeguense]
MVGEKPLPLLVEDKEDVATYIVTCIQADYQIIRANNGQAGIENVQDGSDSERCNDAT